jgi:hypothetical protein
MDRALKGFTDTTTIESSASMPAEKYPEQVGHLSSIRSLAERFDESNNAPAMAAAIEFILEGLHLKGRLQKERVDGKDVYRI